MKKIIICSLIILCVFAGFLSYKHFMKHDITDGSKQEYVYNDEFTAKIPDNMKSSDKLYYSSSGEEQIAFYQNSEACFSVAKIPFSTNQSLKTIDLKTFYSKIEINCEKLNMIPINNGYYYDIDKKAKNVFDNTENVFSIEDVFKGDEAVYSVVIQCRKEDKAEYKDSMLKWLESFELK